MRGRREPRVGCGRGRKRALLLLGLKSGGGTGDPIQVTGGLTQTLLNSLVGASWERRRDTVALDVIIIVDIVVDIVVFAVFFFLQGW